MQNENFLSKLGRPLNRKIPFVYLLICMLIGIAWYVWNSKSKTPIAASPAIIQDCPDQMDQIRLTGFRLINPLVLSDVSGESTQLNPVRFALNTFIQASIAEHEAEKVSVYFRWLKDGQRFTVNGAEMYNPASMLKIAYLITYLKEALISPAVLSKPLYFGSHVSTGNTANIVSFHLPENRSYQVMDLLKYMIKYSDNDATLLLAAHMNQAIYKQLFVDLQLPPPPGPKDEYLINVSDYCRLFRILYNATYLGPKYSEFALELLTECDYKEGLQAGIDSSTQIAHKFGERIAGNVAELHECGVIYLNGNPYMLCVMTEGTDLNQLRKILAEVSRIVYKEFKTIAQS